MKIKPIHLLSRIVYLGLTICLLVGCTKTIKFDSIDSPPAIKTSYYYDEENDCSYVSIESDIAPILEDSGICKSGKIKNIVYKNIRYKEFTVNGKRCEYVLAIYENGKTPRINHSGGYCDKN